MSNPSARRSRDMTELLSEVYDSDRQANNPLTRCFLEAGERVLRHDLLRDVAARADGDDPSPFEKVLAWLTRRRVVAEAMCAWKPECKAKRSKPTEAAYRYRWRSQAGYLRDLVIWALCPRMERPGEIQYASREKALPSPNSDPRCTRQVKASCSGRCCPRTRVMPRPRMSYWPRPSAGDARAMVSSMADWTSPARSMCGMCPAPSTR